MTSDKEIIMVQKAMAYDLLQILQKDNDKKYTVAELENLIDDYITGLEQ